MPCTCLQPPAGSEIAFAADLQVSTGGTCAASSRTGGELELKLSDLREGLCSQQC